MTNFKIGCNFDYSLIDGIVELNKINENIQINELFGSDRDHAYLAARPVFRLPNISNDCLDKYVKKCKDSGIKFNYTMNNIYPGSKRLLNTKKHEILDYIKYLIYIGVDIITISNPILAEFIREVSDVINIEVSTITHIDSVTQIRVWKDRYNINKVCNNLNKNRSIRFLKAATKYCNENNIIFNLMVNEFCGNGGGSGNSSYGTGCIYRDSCYLCHAENSSPEDDLLFNRFPSAYCSSSRCNDSTWLKMKFIRPEDINKYNKIGINNFKITGRTGKTKYILKTAESYIKQSLEGNLLNLWKPLETIHSNEDELSFQHSNYIDNSKLDNFIDFWFNNEDHDCDIEICGETCNYCNLIASSL